jgi:hypothetical protein
MKTVRSRLRVPGKGSAASTNSLHSCWWEPASNCLHPTLEVHSKNCCVSVLAGFSGAPWPCKAISLMLLQGGLHPLDLAGSLKLLWWPGSPGSWKLFRHARKGWAPLFIFLTKYYESFASAVYRRSFVVRDIQRWLDFLTSCFPTPVGCEFIFTADGILKKTRKGFLQSLWWANDTRVLLKQVQVGLGGK